jgi:hypothetical protein
MSYRLVPYTEEWESAVGRANIRLGLSAAAPFLLPDRAAPDPDAGPVPLQYWLVVDSYSEVRGGCLLQSQPAWVDGEETSVVNVQSPLSEGLADRRHAGVAPWLVREIVRRHPFSYSVGMGGEHMPYPRLLRALGWRVEPVPFYFRVLAGRRFLANIQPLRHHPKLGTLAAIGGAIPLLPDAAFTLLHAWRSRESTHGATSRQNAPEWIGLRPRYGFAMDRTAAMLDALYPPGDPNFVRLHVPGSAGVLRVRALQGHAHFGDLVVATLVEAFCQLGAEGALLRMAVDEARAMGAGLLLTNQTAPELLQALESAGWLSYASNYLLAISPPLTVRIGGKPVYVNRGDGDGLLNL